MFESTSSSMDQKNRFLTPFYQPTTVDCERLDSSSSGIQYVPMHVETTKQSHCLCGTCHVVLATKIFLLFYSLITILGLCFGMVSAMVWIMIPIGVIFFTVYGFYKQKHKYFYPFLIISVVQLIVCLIMSFIIALFAIFNYDTLKMIIAYNLDAEPTAGLVFVVVGSTVVGCCVLAVIHVWQVVVIYSCLQFYEFDLLQPDRPEISQQRQTQTAPAVCGDQQSKVVVPKRERSHCPTTDFMA
ncbi:hypothetical protein M3Y94_00676500 [Aphelenchoides besseyi]|nr:hypothetical protein M3Y94_00676500 [Aphelenchoides besseyi]KAI6231393.1 hypothetical protein M3Y95_00376700 [Aphelenchoides besseyi]